jgi:hypothetical protein
MSTHLIRRRKRMKTRGAVVRQAPGKHEVVDLDKAGTAVVTGLGDITEVGVPIPIGELTLSRSGCRARCSVTRTPAPTS